MFASRSQWSQCRLTYYRLPVKFWSRSNSLTVGSKELLLGSLSEKSCDLVGVLAEFSAFALFCLAVIACAVGMLFCLDVVEAWED